jgi:hypothetical protein
LFEPTSEFQLTVRVVSPRVTEVIVGVTSATMVSVRGVNCVAPQCGIGIQNLAIHGLVIEPKDQLITWDVGLERDRSGDGRDRITCQARSNLNQRVGFILDIAPSDTHRLLLRVYALSRS